MQSYPRSQLDERIRSLLLESPLRHVVTLKMLQLFGPASQTRFREDKDGWGLLSVRPVHTDDWDRTAYPDRQFIALIDGTSSTAKLELLADLAPGKYVVKTYDDLVLTLFKRQPSTRLGCSYLSFTAKPDEIPAEPDSSIADGSALPDEIAGLIAENGYRPAELAKHFSDSAHWFAARTADAAVAAGFVFRNYESIWEIGGIYTRLNYRRKGLARRIVFSALAYLFTHGRIPRYQVRSDNMPSVELARSCGLREFLRMDHLLVDL